MPASSVRLYSYFRSSAAFRVRIALNLKGIDPEYSFIHLRNNGQFSQEYGRISPQHFVPVLTHADGFFTQSLAIMEYLDEICPEPPLLPRDPVMRAQVRASSLMIACDIHPLNNLRVLRLLQEMDIQEDSRVRWQRHWIAEGFNALERRVAESEGVYCHGDLPTMADCCLIPQLANARRIDLDLAPYPSLLAVEHACYRLPAFAAAKPDNQPDSE